MQCVAVLQTLDCIDAFTVHIGCQLQAGQYRFAVHENRTGAALTEFTAMLCAGQCALFAQHFEQRVMSGKDDGVIFIVDTQRQGGHTFDNARRGVD